MDEAKNEQKNLDILYQILPHIAKFTVLAKFDKAFAFQDHPNPITTCGLKVYSQNDEDGITLEILRRIGLSKGVFAEFGVGQGLENNTLSLAAMGWSGIWVGGEDLVFDVNPNQAKALNFHFQKAWVKRSNIVDLHRSGLANIGQSRCDLISLDLDGNDYYFVQELLRSGISPEVFIVEYNAKFPPPIRFNVDYDDNFAWAGDDYFGASLQVFFDLFKSHGYFLACCNVTGVNAFFVKNKHRAHFRDISDDINLLYASPKYFLTGLDIYRRPLSGKTIESIFRNLNSSQSRDAASISPVRRRIAVLADRLLQSMLKTRS